jgi:hypothetical protein
VQTGQASADAALTADPGCRSGTPSAPGWCKYTGTAAAPIIFGKLAGIASVQANVSAVAETEPAASAQNVGDPRQRPSPDAAQTPYVVPLVVNECVFGVGPPNCSVQQCPFGQPSVCTLTLDATPATSSLALANVSCNQGCPPPNDPSAFRHWMTCTGGCFGDRISVGDPYDPWVGRRSGAYPPGSISSANAVRDMNGLNPVPGQPATSLLLPVFRWDTSTNPHHFVIVGFSRFVIAQVDWANRTMSGYFAAYRVKSSDTKPGLTDFGVRGIVLTS